jgi:uncharacterized protein (DUF2336 family)
MLKNLFKFRNAAPVPIDYEEAKRRARETDLSARTELARREDVRPEILYYLAEDGAPEVRRNVAANPMTPVQADALLATDDNDEVRCDLARKIARLLPDLDESAQAKLRDLTIDILETLARDQLPRVRQILSEELKHSSVAPRQVILQLAHDVELIVAAPILEYSPLLSDDDLLEIIGNGPIEGALAAVSRRSEVSTEVSDAIVECWNEDAVATLLANPTAQIREETLDRIIDNAEPVEVWHEPLVRRPELSVRAIRRIAGFVASSLIEILVSEHDLDEKVAAELKATVRQRIDKLDPAEDVDADKRARKMHKAGKIDDEVICAELDEGKQEFVLNALALKSDLALAVVRSIIDSKSAKGVTALAWKAELQMRTAMRLQLKLARIPHNSMVNARGGFDYPMDEEELNWHLEYFTT